MKRHSLIPSLLLILTLAVLLPAGAQASTATAGNLPSGEPVQVAISEPGQQPVYTFASTENENVTFNVTHFNITASTGVTPEFALVFSEPGSTSVYTRCNFGDNGYCNFTTPVPGTWSITVVPNFDSVGSFTLTFAKDVPTKALTSGKPVNTRIKFPGQEAGYTFAATANENVTFNVTHFNITASTGVTPEFALVFSEPGSTSVYTRCNFDDNGTCSFNTPVDGTWSIAVIPNFDSVGSFTIKLT
jgi:hypothetical protein